MKAVKVEIVGKGLVHGLTAPVLALRQVLFLTDKEANALAYEPQKTVEIREKLH